MVIMLVVCWSLYKAQKGDNDFNLFDLLMKNGRLSKVACVFMGSWGAMTFVFIGLYLSSKMTEAIYMAYGTVCFAPLIAQMFSTPPPKEKK